LIFSIDIRNRVIRMVSNYYISGHPGMDFTHDFHNAGANERLSAYFPGVETDVEMWLTLRKVRMRRVKDRVAILDQQNCPILAV